MTENLSDRFNSTKNVQVSDVDLVDRSFSLFKDMKGPILSAVISAGFDKESLERALGIPAPEEIPDEILKKASIKLREANVEDDGRLARTWAQMVLMHVAITKDMSTGFKPRLQPGPNSH